MIDYLNVSLSEYVIIFITFTGAYIIFGLTGFGSALVASPILAIYMPVAQIVPLMALIDMCAAFMNVSRDRKNADWTELKRLAPMMIIGSLLGAAILLFTHPDILLLALGLFVTAYSLYALTGVMPQRRFAARAAFPFGVIGGVFSALFGSGGFIYAIYLMGRIQNKESMRITQTTLIGLSTLTRVILFLLAGVYLDTSILWLALLLAPGMLLGTTLGRRITLGVSRPQFIKLVNGIILISGISLIVRYFVLI